MDIITSIIVAFVYMALYIFMMSNLGPGKPSLGIAYVYARGVARFWMFVALSAACNVAIFYYMPMWLTIPLIMAGVIFMVTGVLYLRRAQKQEQKREIEMKLELIAEARALNAEARRAAEAGKLMRAHYLTDRARDIHARIEI